MDRPTMIERSTAAIGQPYTQELHDAWRAHLSAVEAVSLELIGRRDLALRELQLTLAVENRMLRRRLERAPGA